MKRVIMACQAGFLLLPGCAMLRDNVKGSFACQAPGGTCAPSSVIDDAAIEDIASVDGIDGRATPSRHPKAVHGAGSNSARSGMLGSNSPDGPPASTFSSLRIIFPAHVDSYGRLHETAAVRLPLAESAPLQRASSNFGAETHVTGPHLSTLATMAPQLEPDSVPAPASLQGDDGAKPAAANASTHPLAPIDAIKAEVAAALAPARKAPDLPVATLQVP